MRIPILLAALAAIYSSNLPFCASENLIAVPMTRQATDYTCGAAAVQSLFGYFGEDINEGDLAKVLKTNSEEGTDYNEIVRVAKEKGYEVKVYKAVIDRGHQSICACGDEAGIFVIAAGRVKDQEIILGAQSFDLPVKCRLRIMLKHFKHRHGQADATPRNRVAPVFEIAKQCPLA